MLIGEAVKEWLPPPPLPGTPRTSPLAEEVLPNGAESGSGAALVALVALVEPSAAAAAAAASVRT